MTALQLHVEKWKAGCGSTECERARRVVLGRGTLPAEVLFLGEAPGESENVLGKPFCGPAGQLLDKIVRNGLRGAFKVAYTNVVGCIPREDGDPTKKATEPEHDQCLACKPRLEEFFALADGNGANTLKFVVAVGKVASDYTDVSWRDSAKFTRTIPIVSIVHPASILRANLVQRGLMIQRCEVTLKNAAREFGTTEKRV